MTPKMPYDDPRKVQAALRALPGQAGVIVPGSGVRDDVVTHVCPECGGKFNQDTQQVASCSACFGKGEMTNAELTHYEARLRERARDEERRNGTSR